jgi:hypothetical protein
MSATNKSGKVLGQVKGKGEDEGMTRAESHVLAAEHRVTHREGGNYGC